MLCTFHFSTWSHGLMIFLVIPLGTISFNGISVVDLNFFSINVHYILIYYWVLRRPQILGYGFIFFAGIINDIIMGLPMGLSALGYLITALVAMYIRSVTVKMTFFTDWFTFILAIFFSHFVNLILISNFSDLNISYSVIFYNSLFTFIFYPIFWVLFNPYLNIISRFNND